MRIVMLAPSATSAMLTTVLSDTNMTMMQLLRQAADCGRDDLLWRSDDRHDLDRFTGSTTATLATGVVCDAHRLAGKRLPFTISGQLTG
jgi:hypothetical protein